MKAVAKIPVFLSYPKPCMIKQQKFIDYIFGYLDKRGISGRTLGITDYDQDAPLKAIRRLMIECNGIITIAFRRIYIESGFRNHGTDIEGVNSSSINGEWLTSPWSHIEPAMAFQIGLPVLIFRETGVIADGVLEKGVLGNYMPEFSLDNDDQIYQY